MKIYTKKGDSGKTQLLGGDMVDKDHNRIDAYGHVDELNAFIGNIIDQDIKKCHKDFLILIQVQLLNIGSILADNGKKKSIKLPTINEEDIHKIENEIDHLEKDLDPLTEFILPSGHHISSLCHIARTVCRRAERGVVRLSRDTSIDKMTMIFLNRLSDYLFVLSRTILKENGISDTYWK